MFITLGYDFTSGRYSTWSESTWQELSARIFLKPSSSHEALTLAIGFVVMTISFVFVFLVNSKSDIIFGESVTPHVASPWVLLHVTILTVLTLIWKFFTHFLAEYWYRLRRFVKIKRLHSVTVFFLNVCSCPVIRNSLGNYIVKNGNHHFNKCANAMYSI